MEKRRPHKLQRDEINKSQIGKWNSYSGYKYNVEFAGDHPNRPISSIMLPFHIIDALVTKLFF